MNLVGETVKHKGFGIGTIVEADGSLVLVDFGGTQKKFEYPVAFSGFLTAAKAEVQQFILAEQTARNEERNRQAQAAAKERKDAMTVQRKSWKRLPERENVAFKCTYCDGGRTGEVVGFSGICSKRVMEFNINHAKRTWCSDEDSLCRQHLDGVYSAAELKEAYREEGLCYEGYMLTEWRAAAGRIQRGPNRGQPMKMLKVQPNSLCILTTRLPFDGGECDRFIFGVFLIDEAYEGDQRDEGYVSTNSEFKLSLSPKEAEKMLFWMYHSNQTEPDRPLWSQGLHRYLGAEDSAMILRDIATVKRGTPDAELAARFFGHFCQINGIDPADIPDHPYGALTISG